MIRSPIPTTQPQPTTQQAMALAAFNAQQARAAFYGHVLALVDALEPTPTGGLYRRCYRRDGTKIGSLAEWVEAVIDKTLDIKTEASDEQNAG